jgi:hypothetical protein
LKFFGCERDYRFCRIVFVRIRINRIRGFTGFFLAPSELAASAPNHPAPQGRHKIMAIIPSKKTPFRQKTCKSPDAPLRKIEIPTGLQLLS